MPTSKPTNPTKKPKSKSPPKPKSAKRSISVSAKKTNCSPQIGGDGSGDKKQKSSSRLISNIPHPSKIPYPTGEITKSKSGTSSKSTTRIPSTLIPKGASILNSFKKPRNAMYYRPISRVSSTLSTPTRATSSILDNIKLRTPKLSSHVRKVQ